MRQILRATAIAVGLLAAAGAFAAGNSKKITDVEASPEQEATRHFNQGIQLRDAAWKAEKKLAAESDPKKIAKLEKKIRGFYEQAVEEQLNATRLNRRFHEAYSSLGYAYRKLGDYTAALKAYDTALALKPDYPEAIEYRGQAYLGLNRIDEAKKAYMALYGSDAEKAGMLLDAFKAWVQSGPDVPADQVKEVEGWIADRAKLAALTGRGHEVGNGWASKGHEAGNGLAGKGHEAGNGAVGDEAGRGDF